MSAAINAEGMQTVTATLVDAARLRQQQDMTGMEGLRKLLSAVRRMVEWLLAPFRIIIRMLTGAAAAPAEQKDDAALTVAPTGNPPVPRSADPVATDAMVSGTASEASSDEALAAQIAADAQAALQIELTGVPQELQEVLPILQKHIEQVLRAHLPADADVARIEQRLVALAETAERARYAHRIVSRQVAAVIDSLSSNAQYAGMSSSTIIEYVKAAASTKQGERLFSEGSAEDQLVSRLQFRDKIGRDYGLHMQEMATILTRMMGEAKPEDAVTGKAKEVMDSALRAAENARYQLRLHEAQHMQDPPALADSLDEVAAALNKSIVAMLTARAAQAEAARVSGENVDSWKVKDETATAEQPEAEPANEAQVPAETVAPQPQQAAAAPVAKPQGGMFGGAAVVQRSQAEIDEANVVDDMDFGGEENLVAG